MRLTTICKRLCFIALMTLSSMAQAEAVWIDVRTVAENQADNIQGDLLIPHAEIVSRVGELFPNKSTEIYLYCRSGNRAGQATAALKQAGYTAVNNAGSIGDARKQRNILD